MSPSNTQETVADPQWIRAVLRRTPSTRHLHVDVVNCDGHVALEGSVPTRADRSRAGAVARTAATPGLKVVNHLLAADDHHAHLLAPRWQALYRDSCASLVA